VVIPAVIVGVYVVTIVILEQRWRALRSASQSRQVEIPGS
jgi:hypothetical protein